MVGASSFVWVVDAYADEKQKRGPYDLLQFIKIYNFIRVVSLVSYKSFNLLLKSVQYFSIRLVINASIYYDQLFVDGLVESK